MRLQNLDLVTAIMTAFYRLARSLPGIGLLLLSGLPFFPSALAVPCAPVDPFTGAMQADYSPLPHHLDSLRGLSRHCLEQRAAPLNEFALDRSLTAGDAVQPQTAGSNWTATLRFDDLLAVAYGAGLHVAVGDDGTILTSPDGVTCTAENCSTSHSLSGVASNGRYFVAVGGIILRSAGLDSAVGVFRDGDWWFLDADGNGQWDGCQQDGGQDTSAGGGNNSSYPWVVTRPRGNTVFTERPSPSIPVQFQAECQTADCADLFGAGMASIPERVIEPRLCCGRKS